MAKTLTGANAIIMLSIPLLFNTPQRLQGFATDDVYDVDQLASTETQMGVDGNLSGGFVYVPVKQTFSIQSDSDSILFFETWWAAQQQVADTYIASGRTTLNAVQRAYVQTKGFLSEYSPAPSVGKLLKPRKFAITWQSVLPTPN